MRRGDIVRYKNVDAMIVWKKNNQEIGINWSHLAVQSTILGRTPTFKEMRGFGCDEIVSRDEIKMVQQ